MEIEPYDASRLDAIVRLSLRAWKPVFESIANAMDPEVYREQHPDWRVSRRKAVEPFARTKTFTSGSHPRAPGPPVSSL